MAWSFRSRAALAAFVVSLPLGVVIADETRAPEVQLQFADLLFNQSRYADAAVAYEEAQRVGKASVWWRASLGLVRSLLRTADFRRARIEGAQLAEAQPENGAALALYGDALWAAGLFEEAEIEYRQAATLEPDDARARNGLAKALSARSLLDDAVTEARAAIGLAPREGEFHHTLGFVLERARRYEEAAASFRNYMNLLPNKDRSDRALWTGQQIKFLESFGQRQPLAVDQADADRVHVVPFRLVRDKVVVKAKINGRAMDVVLDTGSEMTVVSQSTAARVGIQPIVYTLSAGVGSVGLRGLQVGRMDRLEIGTLTIQNVPTLIKNPPLRGMPTQEIESFSPLSLGFSMQLDYQQRLLTIARVIPQRSFDVELPLRHHRLALVRGRVNGELPVHFVVDTGGEVISVSRATADALKMSPPRHIPLKVYGTSGWDPEAFLLPGVHLAFDTINMPNYAVVVLNLQVPSVLLGFEVGGIVGHRFLSQYSVGIDLRRSVLGLSKIS